MHQECDSPLTSAVQVYTTHDSVAVGEKLHRMDTSILQMIQHLYVVGCEL